MASTTLSFLGASGTVTGSKFLVTTDEGGPGERRILVDAGLFQGEKRLRLMNWSDFPVAPSSISDVLVTHAHLDHCGYLPRLVRHGFTGRIWATRATAELCGIVLRDSAFLQERDADDARSHGYSRHRNPEPLYRIGDVERTLPLFREVPVDRDVDLGNGVSARWTRAGHILGSASIRLDTPGGPVLFSGDLRSPAAEGGAARRRDRPGGVDLRGP